MIGLNATLAIATQSQFIYIIILMLAIISDAKLDIKIDVQNGIMLSQQV